MRVDEMVVTVQELLPAPPETVFALLTDVERMGGLGPENVRSVWQDDRRGVGAVFVGSNVSSERTWDVPCTVVAHDPPRRFGWLVGNPELPSATWTYDLEPADGGSLVTQVFRHGPGRSFVRAAVTREPDAEEQHVAARAADLEAGMRATMQAAARLLR